MLNKFQDEEEAENNDVRDSARLLGSISTGSTIEGSLSWSDYGSFYQQVSEDEGDGGSKRNENTATTSIKYLQPEGSTSTLGGAFIILSAILGSAFLNLPHVAKPLGMTALFVGQVIIGAIATISLMVIGKAVEVSNRVQFQGIIEVLVGWKTKVLADILIAFYIFSTCVSFLMVISDQAIKLAKIVIPQEDMTPPNGTLPTLVKIAVAVFAVYPLCLPRSVKFLSYPSIASFFANIYMAGFSAFYYFYTVRNHKIVEPPKREVNGVAIVNFSAVVIFCYQACLPAPAVYSDLKRRTGPNWLLITTLSMVATFIIYTIIGIFVIKSFGEGTKNDLLNLYEVRDPWAVIARLAIMVSNIASYPVLLLIGYNIIEENFCYIFLTPEASDVPAPFLRYISIKTVFFGSSLICMLMAPDMSAVFAFTGMLSSVSTMALPGLLLIALRKRFHYSIQSFVAAIGFILVILNAVFIVSYILSLAIKF